MPAVRGRTLWAILSRLLVRVAIVVASLAWAGFVFTQTVGDPGRGERIAAAVLADDDARAEVVSPVTAAVMRSTGLPADQQPLVAGEVDRLLQDPGGAQSFIDPFAGSWARMLGEDDPRAASLDLTPLLDDVTAAVGAGAAPVAGVVPIPVTDIPLARVELGWMGGLRRAVDAALVPMAVLAAGLFAIAFMIGERRRVLRRLGAWAVSAGLLWVVVPPLLVWAAGSWATGADSVIAVALDEATSGLLPVALALVLGGIGTFAASFLVPEPADRPAPAPQRAAAPASARQQRQAGPPAPTPAATRTMAATTAVASRPVDRTAAMPATPAAPNGPAAPTTRVPSAADREAAAPPASPAPPAADDDGDALWDYYSS